jgi:hypothetical protein
MAFEPFTTWFSSRGYGVPMAAENTASHPHEVISHDHVRVPNTNTSTPWFFSSGVQIAMNVESGSDQHRFRRLHQILAQMKYIRTSNRNEMLRALEDVRQTIAFSLHVF